MKPNEVNKTKTVTFDEDKNIVREFDKFSKIEKGNPPKFKKASEEDTIQFKGGKNSARNEKEEKGNGPLSKKDKKQ